MPPFRHLLEGLCAIELERQSAILGPEPHDQVS
jgi:hypothetical protein